MRVAWRWSTRAVAVALAGALSGCPWNGFGSGDCTSTPPASIAFVGPRADAVVAGATYFQGLTASAGTMLGPSAVIEAVQVPAGAQVDARGVTWQAPAGLAGATERFRVRSDRDLCGDAAELAWDVHVLAP